jgi:hypothetical protein
MQAVVSLYQLFQRHYQEVAQRCLLHLAAYLELHHRLSLMPEAVHRTHVAEKVSYTSQLTASVESTLA